MEPLWSWEPPARLWGRSWHLCPDPARLGKGFCLHLQRLETACTSRMCSRDWRAPDPTLQAREQLGTHSAHDRSGPHLNPCDTHGEELSSPSLIPTSDPLLMISSQGPSKSSDHLETVSGKQGLMSVSVKSLLTAGSGRVPQGWGTALPFLKRTFSKKALQIYNIGSARCDSVG